MRIKARLFARQRSIVGLREIDLDVADGGTVESAWESLSASWPALESSRPYLVFARNGEFAEPGTALEEGDEVAFIPPVSGGDGTGGSRRELRLTDDPIDGATVRALEAATSSAQDGAVVTFLGITRETPGEPAPGEEADAALHAGQPVLALEYEAYEPLALRVLGEIADEIETRFGVRRLGIVHRSGTVPLGEAAVAIVVAAPHRAMAFDACRYAIDELKARAPIWKSERFADGSVWVGQPARTAAIVDGR